MRRQSSFSHRVDQWCVRVTFAGASSRPSSGSSWGLVRGIVTSDSEGAASPVVHSNADQQDSPPPSPAEAEAQVAARLAQVDAEVEREFALLAPPGQPEHATVAASSRPLSVFSGAPKPRVLPPLATPSFNSGGPFFPGGRRRGAVDMTMAAAAASKQKRHPKRKNGALLQRVHAKSVRAQEERRRAAMSPEAQMKRTQARTLAVFAVNSRPSVAGRVGEVREMGQRIKLGDPAMSLNPFVGPDSSAISTLGISSSSGTGGGMKHSGESHVLQKLGSLAAEVKNETDPSPRPKLMKKLLAIEMERKREAQWRAAQPKSTMSSRAAQKKRKTTRKKNGEVQVKALRDAF